MIILIIQLYPLIAWSKTKAKVQDGVFTQFLSNQQSITQRYCINYHIRQRKASNSQI